MLCKNYFDSNIIQMRGKCTDFLNEMISGQCSSISGNPYHEIAAEATNDNPKRTNVGPDFCKMLPFFVVRPEVGECLEAQLSVGLTF